MVWDSIPAQLAKENKKFIYGAVSDSIFSEYKGAFTELYVLTQLKTLGQALYCHSVDNSTIEIDFLTQWHNHVVPIEVKAEVNVKAKSLRTFVGNNPDLKAVRYSMLPYKQQDWMTNIPLYASLVSFDKVL